MSGTSLDGLDLAHCTFRISEEGYHFEIDKATTVPYPQEMEQRLAGLVNASALELTELHTELGRYIGHEVRKFLEAHHLSPDLISCHGHTIFHQPSKGFSLQIGSGYHIMAESSCTVINDFRSLDIALGGQGAPLVPIGDELLFGDYDFCLNLGGIANLSGRKNEKRIAYDICPANMVLNHLSRIAGKPYDAEGAMAAKGRLQPELLKKLNELDFYFMPAPKSLGYEWVSDQILPLLNHSGHSIEDLLHTFCHHIAQQIKNSLSTFSGDGQQSLLITGGGAYNSYLIKILEEELKPLHIQVVVPEKVIVEFKEALIFALLGVLRVRGEINTLASVTGARQDSCGGQIYEIQ